jgi:hypothetical protein
MAWLELKSEYNSIRVEGDDDDIRALVKHIAQGFRDEGGFWATGAYNPRRSPELTIALSADASTVMWFPSSTRVLAGFDGELPHDVALLARH